MCALELDSLPRDYGDVPGEVRSCRERCALFDFSFIARATVRGGGALAALSRLQTRPMADLERGRSRYALRLERDGTVAADLTIWNVGDGTYEVMSGRREDVADLASAEIAGTNARVEDLTASTCVYALQGPAALDALADVTDVARLRGLGYFAHAEFSVAGIDCRIARLGYTGEPGFELIADQGDASSLWRILEARARPAGVAAADCLRIEAGFVLFVNECLMRPTPEELGLARFAPGDHGAARMRLACFRAGRRCDPLPWRPSPESLVEPQPGTIAITSATSSPLAGACLGLGFVHPQDHAPGRRLVDPVGRFTSVELVPLPFYDPRKRRPRAPWPEVSPGVRQG